VHRSVGSNDHELITDCVYSADGEGGSPSPVSPGSIISTAQCIRETDWQQWRI